MTLFSISGMEREIDQLWNERKKARSWVIEIVIKLIHHLPPTVKLLDYNYRYIIQHDVRHAKYETISSSLLDYYDKQLTCDSSISI
jgi:hypothetical protein